MTNLDAGRTVKASISKVGVSWTAVISNENVTSTDVPAGPVRGVLAMTADGDLSTGAVWICVVLGLVGSVVVCGNIGSAETAFG
ncbi:MAG: hypothetical protein DMF12_09300 [Verrucomicrobia bacterium]|nr:MAG: hypothetical protein DMF12_09300 [Verrucomicrobiota bacterium]